MAIKAAVRVGSRQPHDEKIASMLVAIDGSEDRMAMLIDSIMDFARARLGGGIPVDLKRVENINDGFENVVDEIRLAHPERRV